MDPRLFNPTTQPLVQSTTSASATVTTTRQDHRTTTAVGDGVDGGDEEDNDHEESIRLPPLLKLEPYPSNNNNTGPTCHHHRLNHSPPPNLPHIQTLRQPTSTNTSHHHHHHHHYPPDFIYTGRSSTSSILNQVLISTTQQHQSTNYLSWASRFYKTFPACRFYFHRLDDEVMKRELRFEIGRLGGRVEDSYTDLVTHILFLPPPPSVSASTTQVFEPKQPSQSINNNSLVPINKEERHTSRGYNQQPQQPQQQPHSRFLSPYHSQLTTLLPNSGIMERQTPPQRIEPQEPHPISYRGMAPDFNPGREEVNKNWYYDTYHREQPNPLVIPSRTYQSASPFPKLSNFALSGYPKIQHRRSEIHFFRYPYILSEDVTGIYRPAVAAEYPPAKDPDDVLWPKLWSVGPSRCPFIRMPPRHKSSAMGEKRPAENSAGFRSKMAKNSQNRHHIYPGSLGGTASRDLDQRKRSIIGDLGSSKVGAQRLAALPNGFLHLEKPSAISKNISLTARPIRTKSSAPAPMTNAKKPGYCENCRTKFSDIEEHMLSQTHRSFALKESNFQSLDCLLRRLARAFKPNPVLAPTPTATNPSSSSPHHWYGKSARDYESEATSNPNQSYSYDLAGSDSRSIFPKPMSDQPNLEPHLGGAVLDQF